MGARKILLIVSILSIILIPFFISNNLNAQKIELNWVSFTPKEHPETSAIYKYFIERVNEMAKGELFFRYRGGPETIPPFDQGKAVQKGVVDIAIVPVGFYEPIAPGVGGAMLTQISLEEERKPGGAYDYLNELHKRGGLFYLGRGNPSGEFFVLNLRSKKILKKEDFIGMKIGTATVARACTAAWGATVVSLGIQEYYSAMERGLVDGISSCPVTQWVAQGCHEVTKYTVDHGYYHSTLAVIMNLDKWNRLPLHLQKLIMETMIQSEKDFKKVDEIERAKAREKMMKAGVEFYKFPPEMAKWFIETAYNAAWEYQMKRFPDVTPRLRELLSKK